MLTTQLRLLSDSHVLLWMITRERRIRQATLAAILNPGNQVYVSAASVWEIEIKRAAGRLQAPDNLIEFIDNSGFIELVVTFHHGDSAARLPMHHRDPFDRMLVAQAQTEGLTLTTDDSLIAMYDVPTMAAR